MFDCKLRRDQVERFAACIDGAWRSKHPTSAGFADESFFNFLRYGQERREVSAFGSDGRDVVVGSCLVLRE